MSGIKFSSETGFRVWRWSEAPVRVRHAFDGVPIQWIVKSPDGAPDDALRQLLKALGGAVTNRRVGQIRATFYGVGGAI